MRHFMLLAVALLVSACAALAPAGRDATRRIAVISAFQPELAALEGHVEGRSETVIDGVTFITGRIAGREIVLFLSGVSMVNAAMTTQMALDRFNVDRIVVSGIAGGVDPRLDVGDVVVADRWGQYLETIMARRTATGFELPPGRIATGETFPSFGMIFPRAVQIARGDRPPEEKFWFAADPGMLAVARGITAGVPLKQCVRDQCLAKPPRILVGGNGVSGSAFVDNAELRQWAFASFDAQVLDMETAAVAHVAYVNHTPFIAFRSLSDLAGGDPGVNQARTFFQLASENSAAVVLAFLQALPK